MPTQPRARMSSLDPQVIARNQSLLEAHDSTTSFPLPPVFAIFRNGKEGHRAVLVQATQEPGSQPGIWSVVIVDNPKVWLGQSTVEHVPNNPYHAMIYEPRVLLRRKSSRAVENGKLYEAMFQFANLKIVSQRRGESYPVFDISNGCICLPSRYTLLGNEENQRFRIHVEAGIPIVAETDPGFPVLQRRALEMAEEAARSLLEMSGFRTPRPSAPPVPKPKLPQHMVNLFIEDVLKKGDACPVSMEPLVRETVCITPCGHALDSSSAKCWISNEHSCPVCRASCCLEDLAGWKA